MYPVKVSSTSGQYRQDITINNKFHLTADEPSELGGDDTGATPVELVLAGLGACKAITQQYKISARLHLEGNLTNEQKQRLLEIADRCPVHKLLKSAAQIETVLI